MLMLVAAILRLALGVLRHTLMVTVEVTHLAEEVTMVAEHLSETATTITIALMETVDTTKTNTLVLNAKMLPHTSVVKAAGHTMVAIGVM